MKIAWLSVLLAPVLVVPALSHDFGFAGLLSADNREDLPPLTLSAGVPVAEAPYELKSGTFYRIMIVADGSAELALVGGDFFRAVWVNEIIVNDIEIRPPGLHSLEFDSAGEVELTFVAILPGTYDLRIPGTTGDTQRAIFTIR